MAGNPHPVVAPDVLTEEVAVALVAFVAGRFDLSLAQRWYIASAVLDRCESTGGRVSW